jgi:E3 ubiquitin-protein ligase UBR4
LLLDATQLAVITADFVKIYDLSVDVLIPQYFFLLPSGKVRDCAFWFRQDGAQFTFFISSSGYIYWQPLSQESSARHGPESKDSNGQTGGGGVSVYYSHCLQLCPRENSYGYGDGRQSK